MDVNEFAKMYKLEDSHWWFLGKRRIAEEIITRYVHLAPGSRILDVGCGTGGMLTVLEKYGRAFGLDISSLGLQFASQRGPSRLVQASALRLPFADDTFDLVTSFDVLYHEQVADDLRALQEIFRVCRPGGCLLLTDSALNILRGQHDKAYHTLRRYTVREIREKVTRAGFSVIKASYVNSFLFPVVFFVRLWKRCFNGNEAHRSDLWAVPSLLNSALYHIYGLEAALLPHMRLPIGSSVVCVARKEPLPAVRVADHFETVASARN